MHARLNILSSRRRLAAIAGALCLGAGGAAYADDLVSDGDGVTPYANSDLHLGDVCLNQEEDRSVSVLITRRGEGHVFKNGTTATVSVASQSGATASLPGASTISIPSNWETSANGTQTAAVSASVKVTATTTGSGSGSVTFRATGTQAGSANTALSREDTMAVTWNGVQCDTTAPTSSATAKKTDNTTYTFGDWTNQAVTVTLTGSDNTGGSGLKEIRYTTDGTTPSKTEGTVYSVPFTISAQGTTTIKWLAIDNAGNAQSVQSGDVKIDKAKPVISATGTKGDSTAYTFGAWTNQDVSVSFACADALSGKATDTVGGGGTLDASTPAGGTDVSNTGTCTDAAGNTADTKTVNVKIDKAKPVISATGTKGDSTAYTFGAWTNQDVSVSFACADALSGKATDTVGGGGTLDASTPAGGTDVSNTGTCTDAAGNTADTKRVNVKIDKASPQVTPADVSYTTWRNTSVSQAFTASDVLSNLKADQGLGSGGEFTLTASDESTKQSDGLIVPTTVSKTIEDNAGNATTRTLSALIDKTKPTLGIADANVATTDVCSTTRPQRPGFDPADALSGLDGTQSSSWTAPSAPSGVGAYRFTAVATDNAGNSDSVDRTYRVSYGSGYDGLLQPVNRDGSSRFKLGSTVPVKFALACNGVAIDSAVGSLTVGQSDPTPDAGTDEAISTAAATTGNLFRYDSTAKQYIFNLSTKSGYTNPTGQTVAFSPGTWYVTVTLDDGSSRSTKIQLVK